MDASVSIEWSLQGAAQQSWPRKVAEVWSRAVLRGGLYGVLKQKVSCGWGVGGDDPAKDANSQRAETDARSRFAVLREEMAQKMA